jgi:arabinose-5-phosphate isomerase
MAPNLTDLKVDDIMTREPMTVRADQLASEALELLNASKKTQLIVARAGKPIGVVHVHDLLRAGVA